MHWTVAKLLEATQGHLAQGDLATPVKDISTDTRAIQPGDCFVALSGERHDGHDFIGGALSGGATALLVSRRLIDLPRVVPPNIAVVEVRDTLHALGELARSCRRHHSIPLVGISGSNGKTSTKEMVAGILGRTRHILKNKGNFNNLIGVPLTLLTLGPEHQAAVVEMGINVPGEMARLVEIASPDVGLITNIHPAHLEGLQSMDRILEEKGKLWTGLRPEDLAVVNLDDERLARLSASLEARTVTYSLRDPSARVKLLGEVTLRDGMSQFRVGLGGEEITIRLSVLGMHQVGNAVAAAAVAWAMGESARNIAAALEAHQPVRQRMEMHRLPCGATLVDDSYNANPGSVLAAVRALAAACGGKPLVAVLGEMRELGPDSSRLHRELGRQIGALGVARLITLGDLSREIVEGAREAGLSAAVCLHASSHAEACACLLEGLKGDEWVLVKGSRAMAMEKIVEEALRQ